MKYIMRWSLFVTAALSVACSPEGGTPGPDYDAGPMGSDAGPEELVDAAWLRLDEDTDGDSISDLHEGRAAGEVDNDADGTPDYLDGDSDRDGIIDADEAGDSDVLTPPVDTDGDLIPDFRDTDSDADGLADHLEVEAGTDPTLADTDADGAPDALEVGTGTDPLDASDHPRARGDFVFLMPYEQPPSPARDGLSLSTEVRTLDVYFLMDTTSSMNDEIDNLRASLSRTIIPAVRSAVADTWFGVGGFEDYPTGPYGGDMDRPFYQYAQMASSVSGAQGAVDRYNTRWGFDRPESIVPALWALATGGDLGYGVPPAPVCAAGRGYACFRPQSVPVVVILTDAPSHAYPGPTYHGSIGAPTWTDTLGALNGLGARIVGVSSGDMASHNFLAQAALATGTVDASGSPEPYVFDVPANGSGLGSAVVNAITAGASAPMEMSAVVVDLDDPGESLDAPRAFIDHVVAQPSDGLTCTMGLETHDRPGLDEDDVADTYRRVPPGSPVCFDVVPRVNTTVEPTDVAQLYRARVEVLGQGVNRLSDHVVHFLVPPRVPTPTEPI